MKRRLAVISILLVIVAGLAISQWWRLAPKSNNGPAALPNADLYKPVNPLPLVYVTDLQATVDSDNTIHGTFALQNNEAAAVGNIQYEIQVIQPLPPTNGNILFVDTPALFDRQLVNTLYTAKPNSTQTIAFAYKEGLLPGGNYRLRIQLYTNNERALGWNDTAITLSGEQTFAVIEPNSVEVQSVDPITQKSKSSWQPQEGPNVASGADLKLQATLTNLSSTSLQGTLTVSTVRLLNGSVTPIVEQAGQITLNGGDHQGVSVPITAAKEPGSYAATLSVVNAQNHLISGLGEFRYVVTGASASIVAQAIPNLPTQQGQVAHITFTLAGSADRTSDVAGTLDATLSDNKGELGSAENAFSIHGTTLAEGTIDIPLSHVRCGVPTVALTAKNSDGLVLASYAVTYPNFNVPCGFTQFLTTLLSNHWTIVIIGLIVLLAVFLVAWAWIKSKHRAAAMLLLLLTGSVVWWAGLSRPAQASGIQYIYVANAAADQQTAPQLTIASPIHNSTINSPTVYYSARFTWLSSDNAQTSGTLEVRGKNSAGKDDISSSTLGDSFYTNLSQNAINLPSYCTCSTSSTKTLTLTGNITLPYYAANTSTTLWTTAGDAVGSTIQDLTWLTYSASAATSAPTVAPSAGASAGNGIQVLSPALINTIPGWHLDPTFDNHPVVELFINQPVHNGTYDRAAVPLQYRVEFGVCENEPARTRVIARYDANGGLQSTFLGDANVNWQEVHNATYQSPGAITYNQHSGNCGGPGFCLNTNTYSGTVALSNLPATANKTTLQVVAKWNNNTVGIPSQPDSTLTLTDQMIALGYAHAFNIWLGLTPLATPLPTPTPSLGPPSALCPAGSPEVFVPANSSSGTTFTNTLADGTYKFEIYSPPGLTDDQYKNYTWGNWPTDDLARWHGSSLFLVKNAAPAFAPAADSSGGQRVSNPAAAISSLLLDPPYNQNRTKVADAGRGTYTTLDLKKGDFVSIVVNGILGIPGQGAYNLNVGQVDVRICQVLPATPTPTPSVTPTPTTGTSPSPTPTGGGGGGGPTPTPAADLSITMQAPTSVQRGSALGYAVNVKNNGPSVATGVKVTVPIPTGFTYNAGSSSGSCSSSGSTVTCIVGTIGTGNTSLLSVVLNSQSSLTCGSQMHDTALSTSTSYDPNLGNNSATSNDTTITCTQCEDGIDNNNDGRIDAADPACHPNDDLNQPYDPTIPIESDPQCSDLKDNDGDGLIDAADPNCHVNNDISNAYVPSWDNEAGGAPFAPGGFKVTK